MSQPQSVPRFTVKDMSLLSTRDAGRRMMPIGSLFLGFCIAVIVASFIFNLMDGTSAVGAIVLITLVMAVFIVRGRQRGRAAFEKMRRLVENHRTTSATVTRRYTSHDTDVPGKDGEDFEMIFIHFTFDSANGSEAQAHVTRREEALAGTETLGVGDVVPIYYLPEDPQICALEPHFNKIQQIVRGK